MSPQYFSEFRHVDIAAGEDDAGALALHLALLLEEGRKRRSARSFAQGVTAAVIGAHRFRNLIIRNRNDAFGTMLDDVEGIGMWNAHCHAVGEGCGGIRGDGPARLEGQRIGIGGFGHDANHLGLEAQHVSRGDDAADARAHADGHVDGIERAGRTEQFVRVGGDPDHEVRPEGGDEIEIALPCNAGGGLAGLVEVAAHLDQLGAKCPHRGVLLNRIAERADDGGGDADTPGAEGNGLAVVAARGGDDAVGQPVVLAALHGDDAAPHLEGADGRMVLVLDPDLAARLRSEQRPGILRGGGHRRIDDALGVFEVISSVHDLTP